jgi:hypothetical protein
MSNLVDDSCLSALFEAATVENICSPGANTANSCLEVVVNLYSIHLFNFGTGS